MHDEESIGRTPNITDDLVELVRELAPSNYHLFLHLTKIPVRQTSTQGNKRWSHGITSVSISKVNMLKNSSTVAVCVPINIPIKLGFVSVNGPRETYFVDVLHTWELYIALTMYYLKSTRYTAIPYFANIKIAQYFSESIYSRGINFYELFMKDLTLI